MKNMTKQNEIEKKADWLKNKISESKEDIKKKKRQYKRKASIIKVITLIFSTAITILLGIKIDSSGEHLASIAFIIGALVTLLNALEPFFNFRSLWVEHEDSLYKLYILEDELNFYLTGKSPEDLSIEVLQSFCDKYNMIWNGLSKKWINLRKKNKN